MKSCLLKNCVISCCSLFCERPTKSPSSSDSKNFSLCICGTSFSMWHCFSSCKKLLSTNLYMIFLWISFGSGRGSRSRSSWRTDRQTALWCSEHTSSSLFISLRSSSGMVWICSVLPLTVWLITVHCGTKILMPETTELFILSMLRLQNRKCKRENRTMQRRTSRICERIRKNCR